ncbi:MAG: ABC transporter substrate-binding protein [Chlamydiales bacterium]
MLFGFLIALALAFPLAWVMLHFKTSRSLLQPLFIVIQCIPMFTLAPIMVIWFGWSYIAIIIPTALMIFFPLTLNIYQGLRATPLSYLEYFHLNHATTLQIFFKLRLPWAMPHIFAGVRISAAIAGIGAVAGEWAGAQQGLGVLMLESRRNTDLEITFGALLCLTLLSSSLYSVILLLEKLPRRLTFRWKKRLTRPFKERGRRFSFPLFLFFLAFLTACSQKQKEETRLLLDWLPNVTHIPLYAGVEEGFFAQEEIHLSLQKTYEGGGGISYLTSHKANLLLGHLPGTIKAATRGAKLKILGILIDQPLRCLIFRDKEGIEKPSDLSGKVLGYCIGGPESKFLDLFLEECNIRPKDKKNVSVDLISPLGVKEVDFIYGGFWNVEPFQLRSLGVESSYFPIHISKLPSYAELIVLANEKSKEASPDFRNRFARALQKSIDYAKKNPDKAFASYIRANPDKTPKTIAWEKEAWRVTSPLFASTQEIDLEKIKNFYFWQQEREIITDHIECSSLICE